jgi:uracil-DNA glycosylase
VQDDLFDSRANLVGAPTALSTTDFAAWHCDTTWRPVVDTFADSEVGRQLRNRLQQAISEGAVVYPPQPLRALALTPLSEVKVVVLGQDPYHGPGQANGLAFSVAPGVRIPPSLRNIFKEVSASGGRMHPDGVLDDWARQGVLLLNTTLTVADGAPASHARWGWSHLTDALIAAVARRGKPAVFMLWGAHAQAKRALIEAAADARCPHRILTSNHPSPLAANRPPEPFAGNGHFRAANSALTKWGQMPINW